MITMTQAPAQAAFGKCFVFGNFAQISIQNLLDDAYLVSIDPGGLTAIKSGIF